ncbi:MAG: hypothetical protein ACXV3E_03585, partial [Halobacteriota archaeon]
MGNSYVKFDNYGLRHFPAHLIDIERWDTLGKILTDLYFVETKCRAGMTYDLVSDYVRAREALPGLREAMQVEREQDEVARRYAAELIEYAQAYSNRRICLKENACKTRSAGPLPRYGTITRLRGRLVSQRQAAQQDAEPSELADAPSLPSLPALPLIKVDRNDEASGFVEDGTPLPGHITVVVFHQFVD